MVICVADWLSANKVRAILCFYNVVSGQKVRNKFLTKIVKKRPGRALERGPRDQMTPGQA